MAPIRILKYLGIALLALLVVVYIALPVGFAAYASLRHPDAVGAPPDGFSNLTLTADDGIPLAAWYAPSTNGAAVVLLHGGTGSREEVRGHAAMLREAGFGVLALDLRGHGASGGHGNAFGWEGTRDIRAAVTYLEAQEGVQAIGGLGLSLGGEVLLGALNATPALKAVVSDGATHRSTDEYLAVPGQEGLLRSGVTRLMYAATGLFTGDEPPVPIVDSIAGAPGVRLLVIGADKEPDEAAYGTAFVAAAGKDRAELWVVPGAGHTDAYALDPDAYTLRVTGFLRSVLLASPRNP